MTHYVCPGECGGEADQPGVCHDETCSLHNHPLLECNCTDGQHAEVKAAYHAQKRQEPENG